MKILNINFYAVQQLNAKRYQETESLMELSAKAARLCASNTQGTSIPGYSQCPLPYSQNRETAINIVRI